MCGYNMHMPVCELETGLDGKKVHGPGLQGGLEIFANKSY